MWLRGGHFITKKHIFIFQVMKGRIPGHFHYLHICYLIRVKLQKVHHIQLPRSLKKKHVQFDNKQQVHKMVCISVFKCGFKSGQVFCNCNLISTLFFNLKILMLSAYM